MAMGLMKPLRRHELGLPEDGRVIRLALSEFTKTTAILVEDVLSQRHRFMIRKVNETKYVDLDAGFPSDARIDDICVAPNLDCFVCLARAPCNGGWNLSCRKVDSSGGSSYIAPEVFNGNKWIASLIGPSSFSESFLCVVAAKRFYDPAPRSGFAVDYALCRVSVTASDVTLIDGGIGTDFP
jgi:hypothetical protein